MKELQQDDTIRLTEQVQEGKMDVFAQVLERTEDDRPDGWMMHIKIIAVDGKDVTEEYLEKAFGGEKIRGIPDEKLKNSEELEVIK